MDKININVFYIKKMLFIQDLRKKIFTHQFFLDDKKDMIIYFDTNLNEFWFGENNNISENIKVIYNIDDWYFRHTDKIDFSWIYEEIYNKLISNSKDEIKEIFKTEFYVDDEEFDIFYYYLQKLLDENNWEDWLIFYSIIQNLVDNNVFFQHYFNLIRVKEYVKQRIKRWDLKYLENIINDFSYDDI